MPQVTPFTPGSQFSVSQRGNWARRQQIGYLMQQGVDYPHCLSLAAGLVDEASLPTELVAAAQQRVLSHASRGRLALQYGTTAGSLELRQTLLEYMAGLDGLSVAELGLTTENCLITTGSQQFLDLVTQAVCDPGDICLLTAPTYFVYLSTLEAAGVRPIALATDEQGLIPAALEDTLTQLAASGELGRVKLLYLVTYFDNPAGLTLPENRRIEILEILERWSQRQFIYLLEDAAYRELWFDEPPARSCLALADPGFRDRMIVTQTFSKSLAPGLRTAWGILPPELVKPVTDLKSVHDFGSPHLAQFVIHDLITRGAYQQHVAGLRELYSRKAAAMWQALEQEILPLPGTSASRPQGGLYVWLKVTSETLDTRFEGDLFRRAAQHEQVMFVPGELFYADRETPDAASTMRLSFGVQSETNLKEGIHRLKRALEG